MRVVVGEWATRLAIRRIFSTSINGIESACSPPPGLGEMLRTNRWGFPIDDLLTAQDPYEVGRFRDEDSQESRWAFGRPAFVGFVGVGIVVVVGVGGLQKAQRRKSVKTTSGEVEDLRNTRMEEDVEGSSEGEEA
ncbi:hypothetical protein BV25DRAFT_1840068 [Artomyces pyxidatus]|uniref:Uncharacterized protein n=1 Tax=Artomyces pyxidatus TaxID=48021 RepID=A0ACB8SUD8_9AGAM|nr:hypothetical protein BV25DRAFT_1840068 [Artomyces pyxidatus]